MKQALIAIVVCAAGAGTMAAMLSNHAPSAPPAPDMRMTTLSIPKQAPTPDAATNSERMAATKTIRTTTTPQAPTTAPLPAPLPSDALRAGFRALSLRDTLGAMRTRDGLASGGIEWKALTWAIAVSGQTATPSSELVMARSALSGWPALDDIQINLEKAFYRENAAPEIVKAALGGRAPMTMEGVILLARSDMAAGKTQAARSGIATAWAERLFDPALETTALAEFGNLLMPADHRARLKRLLFAERVRQAERFAALSDAKPLFDAFAAVLRRDRKAADLLDKVPADLRSDPAFLYASVKQLRLTRKYLAAAKLLETMPRDNRGLVDPDAWWVEARIVSRALQDMGRMQDAYDLANAHLARSTDNVVEAEFHAGWYALRGMKKPKLAEPHFRAILAASSKSHDLARAYYWLGRTAEAGGPGDAKQLFLKAADYPATFYGQLAASRIGAPFAPGLRYRPTLDIEQLFMARPEIQAAKLMEACGENGRARWLYLRLARLLDSPSELQTLADVALTSQGPSLALAIGKTALNQGHDPGLAAFPLGAIPDAADISGSGRALAYAIARQESAFNPQAVSPANARGLLQLLPSTAKHVAERYQMAWAEEKLTDDPAYNATLGSHYLGEQIDKFNGSFILTFAAYNAGPNRIPQWIKKYGDPRGKPVDTVVDWIENIPFQETRDYVQRVMENYQVYKSLLAQNSDIASDLRAGGR